MDRMERLFTQGREEFRIPVLSSLFWIKLSQSKHELVGLILSNTYSYQPDCLVLHNIDFRGCNGIAKLIKERFLLCEKERGKNYFE